MDSSETDWKLKLRYGKLEAQFTHFTVFADGVVGALAEGFECRPGRAWMAMKTWATDADESAHMTQVIGRQIGFSVDGKIEVYASEPEQPPGESPHGYDIGFTPYDENA